MISSYHCYPPIFDHCKAPSASVSLVVNRKFNPNTCFLLNYTTQIKSENEGNKSQSRLNNSLYLCVKKVTQKKDLQLVGYLKKTSEEDLSTIPPKVQFQSNEVGLERFLFKQNDVTTEKTEKPSNKTTEEGTKPKIEDDGNFTNSTNDENESKTIQDEDENTTMFRVTVFRNGTLAAIQFNKN